jgi:uncharacterized protein with von Willebrand factor type A (vWA) domain
VSEKKTPRPVSRQELQKLQVTDADAFTALRFLRHRDATPALPEIEERGEKKHTGSVGCLADLYHALWAPEPQVRDEGEVPADRKWWRQLMAQTVSTAGYQELHAATELSDLKSVLGTVTMGETVLACVSDEDAEKIRETADAQAEADELAEEAAQAQAEADAMASVAQAAGNGQSQPSMGQKSGSSSGTSDSPGGQMSAEQAKAIANQLEQEWMKAQQNADATTLLAQEAQVKADALAEATLGKPGSAEAEQKLRELARIGQAAMKAAKTKVEEVSSTIEAWGLDEGELSKEGIPESLALLERMRQNTSFKKFAALLGRLRKIAAKKARSKEKGEGLRVTRRETGRDIRRADPREIIALSHPALRTKALTRWSRGELTLRGEESKPRLGHGPVIVCEDGSGSMDGAKQQWAKAVTLSLAHFSKLQKRSFGWMLFDYSVRKSGSYPAGKLTAKELLEIAEARSGGGTDFESPLRKALEMIKTAGLKKADIVFITDGECAVSDKFLREFAEAKRALEFNVMTILCDVGSTSDATVAAFSERVECVSAFSAEEAEAKVFGNL